ncbi:MAG: universal stress protein [Candidatus Magnetominusculus sp. LBB02]|nr:universal stress protein [Candidatus Magnetominusculus sp. LBB02]
MEKGRPFKLLICTDGSSDAMRGMRYGAKLGRGIGAEITIFHVCKGGEEQPERELVGVGVKEKMYANKSLGMSIPEIRYLEEARLGLIAHGWMAEDWVSEQGGNFDGDLFGDFQITHHGPSGEVVNLKLKNGRNAASEILDEIENGAYNLVIIGASKRSGLSRIFLSSEVQKVVVHAPCSVLIARELEAGHGHLVGLDGSAEAYEMMHKDVMLASRCECPVSLISVARYSQQETKAREIVEEGQRILKSHGLAAAEIRTAVGDPVEELIKYGRNYSVIVLNGKGKSGLTKRFFMGGTVFNVVLAAENSVMVVR